MYRSPNIVRMIKSRKLRWIGHVARMEEGMLSRFSQLNLQERDLYEGFGEDGIMILKLILNKWVSI